MLLVALALAPAVAGAVGFWRLASVIPKPGAAIVHVLYLEIGLLASVVLTVLSALAAARWTRRPGARILTAWRGNLRRVLPISILLCALAALGLAGSSRVMRARWIRDFTSGRYNEMAWVIDRIGRDKWEHPPIPKDAWRAEPPPVAK